MYKGDRNGEVSSQNGRPLCKIPRYLQDNKAPHTRKNNESSLKKIVTSAVNVAMKYGNDPQNLAAKKVVINLTLMTFCSDFPYVFLLIVS